MQMCKCKQFWTAIIGTYQEPSNNLSSLLNKEKNFMNIHTKKNKNVCNQLNKKRQNILKKCHVWKII